MLETGNVTVIPYPDNIVAPFQRALPIEVGMQPTAVPFSSLGKTDSTVDSQENNAETWLLDSAQDTT